MKTAKNKTFARIEIANALIWASLILLYSYSTPHSSISQFGILLGTLGCTLQMGLLHHVITQLTPKQEREQE